MYRIFLALILLTASHAARAEDQRIAATLERWDADSKHDLKGVIVLKDGRVVAERYYAGADADTLHDVRSAGKSVTSLLLGIVVDRGGIRSIDDPVARYWPEAKGSAIGSVPIRDVLTMRSGLAAFDADPDSPGNEDRVDEALDPAAFILGLPRADAPGTRYRYNSVTSTVAGIVTAKASGQRMDEFAAQHLFAPLGISRWRWEADRSGYTKGQGNLSLTLRGFAAIGEMVRNGGRYRGKRVVSRAWISQALAPHVAIGDVDPYADSYGYFWYGKTQGVGDRQIAVSFASGNGGNKIYVVPRLGMVVAVMSSAYGRGYGQKRSEQILKDILADVVE
ncbi:6-aminohexanoate-dimer hydrolase [Sphingomonas sp. DBB INV C78]|uniref:serine hydrolase domain-containing protein n=1 Tax=Sphingomonas sp. DBB INV C78 TaxID=3349434 RepID=UPI0036D2BCF4